MTDKEIIKALECCAYHDTCDGCPMRGSCITPYEFYRLLYDLINRQKAEIERLKKENLELEIEKFKCNTKVGTLTGRITLMERDIPFIKAEAIKDFAERLKERTISYVGVVEQREVIDNLVKEMIGGNNESIQQEDC